MPLGVWPVVRDTRPLVRLCDTAGPMPTLPAPSPLALWPTHERARIRGVLTDIDDTLTTNGTITQDALNALHRLRAAGLPVLAITGRPAGWPTQLPGRLIKTPLQLKWPANLPTAGFGPPSGLRSLCPDSGAARDRAGRHYFFRFVLGPSPTTGWPDPPGAWARLNSQQGSQKPEPGR